MSATIRPPHRDELPALRDIELAAGRLFADVGLYAVADDEPYSLDELTAYLDADRIWVATVDDRPAGYATVSVVDGEAHLDQVSVDPTHGRRGIGRTLVAQCCAWAAAEGHRAITLTTYRDLEWNGPFYERCGFVVVPDDHGPELAAIRAAERAAGLDVRPRVAMRRAVP